MSRLAGHDFLDFSILWLDFLACWQHRCWTWQSKFLSLVIISNVFYCHAQISINVLVEFCRSLLVLIESSCWTSMVKPLRMPTQQHPSLEKTTTMLSVDTKPKPLWQWLPKCLQQNLGQLWDMKYTVADSTDMCYCGVVCVCGKERSPLSMCKHVFVNSCISPGLLLPDQHYTRHMCITSTSGLTLWVISNKIIQRELERKNTRKIF